jgi:hypothetical protein
VLSGVVVLLDLGRVVWLFLGWLYFLTGGHAAIVAATSTCRQAVHVPSRGIGRQELVHQAPSTETWCGCMIRVPNMAQVPNMSEAPVLACAG